MLLILSLTFCILPFIGLSCDKPPNVVFIWFDDLGFSETGFNGGMFETPILDEIAANSILLTQHYTELICSASRSAMLTGRYSWKTGLNYLAQPFTVSRINSDISLLPELLKEKNYRSHITGKYHLGYKKTSDQPFERGFDEGLVNFVGSTFYSRIRCKSFSYFDDVFPISDNLFTERNNLFGTKFCGDNLFDENYEHPLTDNTDYIERILTDDIIEFIDNNSGEYDAPFFVYNSAKTPHGVWVTPPDLNGLDYNALCGDITDDIRLKLCKMVQYEENMIGEIIDTLKKNNIYSNTVVIITSDNGGAAGIGRNLPLRGTKGGAYEGGIRTMALITGGYVDDNILLKNTENSIDSCQYNELFHVSDWYHTILSIADLKDENADDDHRDIDQWKLIQKHCNPNSEYTEQTERDEIIYMRMCGEAPNQGFYSTFIRNNEWKLVINGSITDLADCPREPVNDIIINSGYAGTDESFTKIPNENEYMTQFNNAATKDLYNSQCYNGLSGAQRDDVNNQLFAYKEFMLFNIESDKIEACNVADQYPEKVEELFNILKQRAYEYDSRNDLLPIPNGGAVLAQINTYDCNKKTMSLVPWDWHNNDETDFEYIWQTYIDVAQNCPAAKYINGRLMEDEGNVIQIQVGWGMAIGALFIVTLICNIVFMCYTNCNRKNGNSYAVKDDYNA